jgi:hypothetical protein
MSRLTACPAAALVNLGIQMTVINPGGELFFAGRTDDGDLFQSPLGAHPEAELAFAGQLMDAAAEVCRKDPTRPLSLREGGDGFRRMHLLTEFSEMIGGARKAQRNRFLWTREERRLSSRESVPHGETFMMLEMGDLTRGRALLLHRGLRGFDLEVHQGQYLKPVRESECDEDVCELAVVSSGRGFWERILRHEAPEALPIALLISARFYLEAPDLFGEGFDVVDSKSSKPRAEVRFDDLGRPVLLKNGQPVPPSSLRLRGREASIVSRRQTFYSGRRQPVASVHWEKDSEFRASLIRGLSESSLASVFLQEAAEKALAEIHREIGRFEELPEEERRAALELRARVTLRRNP